MYNGIYTRFMDVFRRTHKAPFILPFYSSGMTSVAVWHWLVRSDMFSESQICSSCILAKSYAVMIGSGIVLPFLTTPWLVQFFVSFITVQLYKIGAAILKLDIVKYACLFRFINTIL